MITVPAVSVIIPIHNSREFLENTLKYLELQTFTDFEVIFVDDASEDDPLEFLDQLCRNSGILYRVIKLETNQGCGAARNAGIREANGNYIICLDVDDYYHPQLLQQMYSNISKYDAEVVLCSSIVTDCSNDTKRIFGQWRRICELKELNDGIFVCDNPFQFEGISDLIDYVAWNKMLKKDYFIEHELWFPHMKYYEDISFSFNAILQSNRTVFITEPLIDYYRCSNGSMTSWTMPKEHFMIDAFNLVLSDQYNLGHSKLHIDLLKRVVKNLEAIYKSDLTNPEDKEIIYRKVCQRAYKEWHIDDYATSGIIQFEDGGLFSSAKEQYREVPDPIIQPLLYGDKVVLCAMSDPVESTTAPAIAKEIADYLGNRGVNTVCLDDYEFNKRKDIIGKSDYLNRTFADKTVKYIFDVSGGDLANELLDHLNKDIILNSNAIYAGYSDLTVITNAIYAMVGKRSLLYRINNLFLNMSGIQRERFINTFFYGGDQLLDIQTVFYKGTHIEGVVIGGNIRCFLKLAGTPFYPDFTGKILFLESLNDDIDSIRANIAQLKQQGVFNKIGGLIIGAWGKKENENASEIDRFILSVLPEKLPVVKTCEVGHGHLSKAIVIGGYITINSKGECKWII